MSVTIVLRQSLTQAQTALCLPVNNVDISERHLRRRVGRLQLYRQRHLSGPVAVVNGS